MKNTRTRQVYRWVRRVLDPIVKVNVWTVVRCLANIPRYGLFLRDFVRYRSMSRAEQIRFVDLYPFLDDREYGSWTGKGQYFYQDIWALRKVRESGVTHHVDVGSRIDGFTGQCSAICAVEFVDLRKVELRLPDLSVREGDILHLPYDDQSIESLSCLHVLEHIGLGRYVDAMNPEGSREGARELTRVLAPGGSLYLGIPIGRERVAFNAHRFFSTKTILNFFQGLHLEEFSAITDDDVFVRNASLQDFENANDSCGLFHFTRRRE